MKQTILVTGASSGFGLMVANKLQESGYINPKFNHPVGKGVSVLLGLQHFTYKTYEKAIIKSINNSGFSTS